MKRRYPPILTEDPTSGGDPDVRPRLLAARLAASDRTALHRRGWEGRRGSVPRIVVAPAPGLGLGLGLGLGMVATWLAAAAFTAFALLSPVVARGADSPDAADAEPAVPGLTPEFLRALAAASRPASNAVPVSAPRSEARNSPLSAVARVPVATPGIPAGQRSTGAALALREAVEVDGEGIFLDQVLVAEPATPLPHLRLAPAPVVGQVTLLTRTQVVAWIEANAPAVLAARWKGAEEARVVRRTRSLEEVEVRDMLRTALQREHVRDRGELELRFARAWSSIVVPDEPLSLRVVDLPASGVGAHFIVRFELWAGEERVGSWQVSAAAKVWREVLVAESGIRRGQLLRGAPIIRERRDILTLRDPAVAGVEDEAGELEFRENVMAGHPIFARALRVRPVVFRGSIVDGVVNDGAMTINLKVEVLEDGLPGHVVRVRNPKTRREMLGKVQNEQTILLPM
jgi:flagella basal body P-ring formation protein FlgA